MLMEAMCVKYQNNESLSSNDLSLNRSAVESQLLIPSLMGLCVCV